MKIRFADLDNPPVMAYKSQCDTVRKGDFHSMKRENAYPIVVTGLMVAVGLILPYFTGHAFGMPGTVLLPMHIPVLLCGLLCGPKLGAMVGVVIPVLSSLLTGMPPAYPMLPIMGVQLLVMGLVSGLLYRRFKVHMILSLLGAMVSGWIAYGLMFAGLALASGGALRALSVTAALAQGVPGMAIQLVLIPALVALIQRYTQRGEKGKAVTEAPAQEPEAPAREPQIDYEKSLPEAIGIIKSGEATCVVMQEGEIIHTASGRGVSPLLKLYREMPERLAGAVVADKIIGKAAAMILLLGGARAVYGEIMSVAARDYLVAHNIPATSGRCVDVITSRDKKGICPIEQSVLDTDDAEEGLARMTEAIARLMRAG